jgi:hypothetical protein
VAIEALEPVPEYAVLLANRCLNHHPAFCVTHVEELWLKNIDFSGVDSKSLSRMTSLKSLMLLQCRSDRLVEMDVAADGRRAGNHLPGSGRVGHVQQTM